MGPRTSFGRYLKTRSPRSLSLLPKECRDHLVRRSHPAFGVRRGSRGRDTAWQTAELKSLRDLSTTTPPSAWIAFRSPCEPARESMAHKSVKSVVSTISNAKLATMLVTTALAVASPTPRAPPDAKNPFLQQIRLNAKPKTNSCPPASRGH